jgi:carbonic anhydrase/acetyltransferase-like protein (isoleucine patch superfamily)
MTLEQRFETFLARKPTIDPTAYVAPEAVLIGDVRLGPRASIWPCAVLRGDINYIQLGEGTNVQDGAVVHLADDYPAILGDYVTVGHQATIHACTIGNRVLIGMQAVVLDGAEIGDECIIGAQALVTGGMKIPAGSLVLGSPGKIVKALTAEQRAGLKAWADKYVQVSAAHRRLRG